jgi:hypothetical protein
MKKTVTHHEEIMKLHTTRQEGFTVLYVLLVMTVFMVIVINYFYGATFQKDVAIARKQYQQQRVAAEGLMQYTLSVTREHCAQNAHTSGETLDTSFPHTIICHGWPVGDLKEDDSPYTGIATYAHSGPERYRMVTQLMQEEHVVLEFQCVVRVKYHNGNVSLVVSEFESF